MATHELEIAPVWYIVSATEKAYDEMLRIFGVLEAEEDETNN